MSPVRVHVSIAAIGLAFGAALSLIGFTDWNEVHRMFTFQDLRLVFVFGGALALNTAGFAALPESRALFRRAFAKERLSGGALFGAGWALTGACPSICAVQLGEGQLGAIVSIAGILGGMWLFARLQRAQLVRVTVDGCAT